MCEQFVNLFSTFCCTLCDKLNAQLCRENISSTFKLLENICENLLSDTRKHTIGINQYYGSNVLYILYTIYFIYTIFREGYTFSYKPVYQVALYKQLIKHNTTIYKLYIKI